MPPDTSEVRPHSVGASKSPTAKLVSPLGFFSAFSTCGSAAVVMLKFTLPAVVSYDAEDLTRVASGRGAEPPKETTVVVSPVRVSAAAAPAKTSSRLLSYICPIGGPGLRGPARPFTHRGFPSRFTVASPSQTFEIASNEIGLFERGPGRTSKQGR
jgi:hypothetical protein